MAGKQSSAPIDHGSVGTSIALDCLGQAAARAQFWSASVYLGGLFYIFSVGSRVDNQLRSRLCQIPYPATRSAWLGRPLPESFDSLIDLGAIGIERGRDHDSAHDHAQWL
jgi:hypothetical protein